VVYLEIFNQNIAILGSGNIGSAIAKGFILSSMIKPEQIILTRRNTKLLSAFEKKGCIVLNNNCEAVKKSEIRNKKLNDFVVSKNDLAKIGKIIIENKDLSSSCGIAYYLRDSFIRELLMYWIYLISRSP